MSTNVIRQSVEIIACHAGPRVA